MTYDVVKAQIVISFAKVLKLLFTNGPSITLFGELSFTGVHLVWPPKSITCNLDYGFLQGTGAVDSPDSTISGFISQ